MEHRTTRRSLLTLAGGASLALAGAIPRRPLAAAGDPPSRSARGSSGLPWPSGMCGRRITAEAVEEIDEQEEFRGRKLDVQTTFAHWRNGWEGWLDAPYWRRGLPELLVERGIRNSHSVPLLCAGSEGAFAECAQGDFDPYHRTIALRLRDLGGPPPIVRLGWEATQRSYPWNALRDTSPGYGRYKDAFRRIADIYRREIPGCQIDWNNLRRPRVDIADIYPGDDWVDIVGADLYWNEETEGRDDDWEAFANNRHEDGPAGPVPYAEFAISRGKMIGVAEWGVTNRDRKPYSPYDSDVYIEGMWDFFRRYKDHLSYECYFNRDGGKGDHRIHPADVNPRASAAYRALWRP